MERKYVSTWRKSAAPNAAAIQLVLDEGDAMLGESSRFGIIFSLTGTKRGVAAWETYEAASDLLGDFLDVEPSSVSTNEVVQHVDSVLASSGWISADEARGRRQAALKQLL